MVAEGHAAPCSVELLAPAGEPRALRAALSAGADAVYFGLERWSARAFAGNFAGEAVLAAIDLAHLYDARAYLALNTLLKDDEVEPALAALEAPYLAGLDALIVADLGLMVRVSAEYPGLPLHASTQLGTHSSAQLAALARLGCERAVLARELSLREIAALRPSGVDLEAFVHGALCYGYSGDCLLSSMIGGRSGNRGRCSQACRLRYDARHGEPGQAGVRHREPSAPPGGTPLGGGGSGGGNRGRRSSNSGGSSGSSGGEESSPASRMMSTLDLAAIRLLPQLLAAGVTSFKIEGRMKDAAYVGATTAIYRAALDAAVADPEGYEVRPEWLEQLEQSFSRGFSSAHLEGRPHEVRSGGRGGHRGVLVGRVARVEEARGVIEVRLAKPVSGGDLVYFYTPWGQSEPLRLAEGGQTSVTLRAHERVALKDRLFRLAAAEAGELAQDLVTGRVTLRPIIVRMLLDGEEGAPARLTVAPEHGGSPVVMTAAVALAAARTAALTADKAREALGALGGTPYHLGELAFAVPDGLFMPVGELKDLRRRALAELDRRRLASSRRVRRHAPAPPAPATLPGGTRERLGDQRAAVILLVRPGERPLLAPGVSALCLDLRPDDPLAAATAAAEELRATGLPLRVRLSEILFDEDEEWWRAILALPWQSVYARHLGVVEALRPAPPGHPPGLPYILEYPLQGLNGGVVQAASRLVGRAPQAVVVSPEASLDDIDGLALGTSGLEILAFGRQQLLHTRDQLGRADGLVDPPGAAQHAALVLTDAKGYEFPASVDLGGSRLFNARVTNLAPNLDDLAAAGVRGLLVVQSDLDRAERSAFAKGGLGALAPMASRERSTTGHLFRGVA